MNYNGNDDELAELIQRPEGFLPWRDNSGRVNPVFRPVQPRVILAPPGIQRDIDMPSN
jgi:hypothetical protein